LQLHVPDHGGRSRGGVGVSGVSFVVAN
jgi:hypothetical protein